MISRRNYLTIFILLLMVLGMFMFTGISSGILSNTSTNSAAVEKSGLDYRNAVTAESLNLDSGEIGMGKGQKPHIAILSADKEDTVAKILVEWCVYNKYPYKIFTLLPGQEELSGYDVFLFGDYTLTVVDSNVLYGYAQLGLKMIFTKLPDSEEMASDSEFAAFFGIEAVVNKETKADGIKIFSNFMLNTERIYTQGDYFGEEDDTIITIPYFSLAPGYEVYSVGLLNNQDEMGIKEKDLPPLLWRTSVGNSYIFAVNSEIFSDMSLLGILTGFMANSGVFYLYPIVNAQTISLIDYPYFSNENKEIMNNLYSRGSEAVGRDILWPNIVQILKNYGDSYSFFSIPQLDYLDEVGPTGNYTDFYLKEIGKLPGVMGLSLDQVSDIDLKNMISQDSSFFSEVLPEYDFTALYAGDFSVKEISENLNHGFLKDISLVMSDYNGGGGLIGFVNDDTLSVKFTQDGFRHETLDDIRMLCVENALGMSSVKVDMGRVFYPWDSQDEWNQLSLAWSKGNTYFNDFKELDMVSVYEMENRIRRFLILDYTFENTGDDINIQIEHFDEEAYFIINVYSKTIDYVEHGSSRQISENTFLIKADDKEVRIHLKEENVLEKPANNKLLPGNPE